MRNIYEPLEGIGHGETAVSPIGIVSHRMLFLISEEQYFVPKLSSMVTKKKFTKIRFI